MEKKSPHPHTHNGRHCVFGPGNAPLQRADVYLRECISYTTHEDGGDRDSFVLAISKVLILGASSVPFSLAWHDV